MRNISFVLLLMNFVLRLIAQSVLSVSYDAKSLTEEEYNSNPDYLIYPVTLVEKVDLVEMFCENDMIAFSVSKTKQVKFSPGNLQYQASTKKWRFAPKQTDYIGEANNNIEWEYIFRYRTNYSQLYGYAQVAGVNGVIILPDHWRCPDGITFKPGFYRGGSVTDNYQYAAHQTFTTSQWDKLQQSGAIFLPAAGTKFWYTYGNYSTFGSGNHVGYYWSSTASDNFEAYMFPYFSTGTTIGTLIPEERRLGKSVRLVQDL